MSENATPTSTPLSNGPLRTNSKESEGIIERPVATATERGWDGWPTQPTPEYLIPGMGKVPVSSAVHFQTVVMTEMGEEISAGKLRDLRGVLLSAAKRRPERRWVWDDKTGRVTVTTVPVRQAPPFEFDESELELMVQQLRGNTEGFVTWRDRWLQDASEAELRAYEEAMHSLRMKEKAAESDQSELAQNAVRDAQRDLIISMGRLMRRRNHDRQERDHNEARMEEVSVNLPKLFQPPVSSLAGLVDRLEEAGITAKDVDVDLGAEFTVQDAVSRVFNIRDESLLDPLNHAQPDAMDTPAEGVILYHEQGWYARGLALGNLMHSVALAPGEVTQIAMTHWNHTTRASDSETVSQEDSTTASDLQNRSVSEIQQGATAEHMSGGSSAVSFGESAQAGYAGFGVSASGGVTSNVSTAVTHSEGAKNLSMDANQRIAAVTQRHAEAARTRRATVVREVSQSEDQNLTTRVLANYNHMHALTVMYFEVIEVFDLKTRVVDAERVIFLPYKVREVQELIPRFRAVLIDAANAAGKPELAEAIRHYQKDLSQLDDLKAQIEQLDGPAGEDAVAGDTAAGEIAQSEAKLAEIKKALEKLPGSYAKLRGSLAAKITELVTQRAATMAAFKEAPNFLGSLAAQAVQAQWQTLDAQIQQLKAQLDALTAAEARAFAQLKVDQAGTERLLDSLKARSKQLKDAKRMLENSIKPTHKGPFHDNRLYFNQAVWLSLSPGEVLGLARRLYMFKGEVLCEHIDPEPVAITGNYVAYRWRFDDPIKTQKFKQRYIEPFMGNPDRELATVKTTVAVPTGGVFGEAVLGQAVSAEKIDLSRFWNWKDSMIPILPTGINPLTAATPAMQDLSAEPGKLDESSAKLGQLQDLPAPSGFQALAETMRAQMFRDMSGQTMLQSLAEATTKAAASGSAEAGKLASENYKAGLAFVKEMAPKVMEALASPETGGASLVAGKLNAKEGGGTSLLGGMLNAKGADGAGGLLSKLVGSNGNVAEKVVGDVLSGGEVKPEDPKIPEDELEDIGPANTPTP